MYPRFAEAIAPSLIQRLETQAECAPESNEKPAHASGRVVAATWRNCRHGAYGTLCVYWRVNGGLAMQQTILICEDEEGIRTLFGGVLEEEGYRVLTAVDGEEG
jgi:hypothetical protein